MLVNSMDGGKSQYAAFSRACPQTVRDDGLESEVSLCVCMECCGLLLAVHTPKRYEIMESGLGFPFVCAWDALRCSIIFNSFTDCSCRLIYTAMRTSTSPCIVLYVSSVKAVSMMRQIQPGAVFRAR